MNHLKTALGVSHPPLKLGDALIAGRRWYGLPKTVTGELSWERNSALKQKQNQTCQSIDRMIEKPMANLKRCRYAKVKQLNEVYDKCMTDEDLKKAEKLLVAYRHSLSFPRYSLPMVLTRACIRLGKPGRALHYARNKVQFGVFPTRKVYNVLMDACLKRKNARGAMSAYDLLLSDECEPDGMTYYMAAKAALHLELERVRNVTGQIKEDDITDMSEEEAVKKEIVADQNNVDTLANENGHFTDESAADSLNVEESKQPGSIADVTPVGELDLTQTLELCNRCLQLEPKLGTKTYRRVFTILLNRGHIKEASGILDSLQAKNEFPKQTVVNLKLDLFTSTSDYENAFSLLTSLGSPENAGVGVPGKGLLRLHRAIQKTGSEELEKSFKELNVQVEPRP